MKRKWFFIVPLAILAMLLFAVIGGEIVLRLWNWLLPPLFGWRQLTFWQALGLLTLCRILFGELDGAAPAAPVSAVAWHGVDSKRPRKSGNNSGRGCANISVPAQPPERTRGNKAAEAWACSVRIKGPQGL